MELKLANKYRPTTFDDVVGQDVCVTSLRNQINKNDFGHVLLFVGTAGCGKTTCAQIFARMIDAEVTELDCAKHNGVDHTKEIIDKAMVKPLIKDYKVIIFDECQTLSKAAWDSLLSVLENDIPTTIFMFCTTDPQKIPNTILSRAERYNILPIPNKIIFARMKEIVEAENINITDNALKYIIRASEGSLRQTITHLSTCLRYSTELTEEVVCKVVGIIPLDICATIYKAFEANDKTTIINQINEVYNSGYELHQFVKYLLDYCVKRPNMDLLNRILTIERDTRNVDSPKNLIIANLIV